MFSRWLPGNPVHRVAILAIVVGLGLVLATAYTVEQVDHRIHLLSHDNELSGATADVDLALKDLRHFAVEERLRLRTGSEESIPRESMLDAYAGLRTIGDELEHLREEANVPQVSDATAALTEALLSYFRSPGELNLMGFETEIRDLAGVLAPLYGGLQGAAAADAAALDANVHRSAYLIVGAMLITLAGVTIVAWKTVSRLRSSADGLSEREASLAAVNTSLTRRNSQFDALYNIVTEVTESLSMKYVVQTTVREARKLVDAQGCAIRILNGERLELAGIEPAATLSISSDQAILLGEGPEGRAAKRGRSLWWAEIPADMALNADYLASAGSAIIVPLIVGARVVGTLTCWSGERAKFNADDSHFLEMMASQVATAVVAAGVHETTDQAAHRDPLTELPNCRQLTEDSRYEYQGAARRGRSMALAMLDIDHFKVVNDTYGHKSGDVVLQQVATILGGCLRAHDQVYRYGGEEFLVVFDTMGLDQATAAVERIRQTIASASIALPSGEVVPVTISAGVAVVSEAGADFDSVLASADEALYQAKEDGRNRVNVATTPVSQERRAA